MESWMLVPVAVLIIGIAVIVYGGLRDRTRRAEAEQRAARLDGSTAGAVPRYLDPADVVRALPPARPLDDASRKGLRRRLESVEPTTTVGWADEGFVTDPPSKWSVLDEPRVLIVAGVLAEPRLAVALMGRMRRRAQPLVIIAEAFAPPVLEALVINTRRGVIRMVALQADATARDAVAAATGATVTELTDLYADYVPDDHLGRVGTWVSSADDSWSLPTQDETDEADEAGHGRAVG